MKEILCKKRAVYTADTGCGNLGLRIVFSFSPKINGTLSVGRLRTKVENGRALLDLSPLPDGEYEVTLAADTRTDPICRLEKSDGRVYDVAWRVERLLRMEDEVRTLKEALAGCRAKIQLLEEKIGSDVLLSL